MSSLSIAKSRNLESTAPKKGSAKSNTSSRRKVPTAATAKKPPRSVESKGGASQIVSGILSREHVHMLVEIPPHQPVSDFVRRVKGRSSHRLQREFSDLRMFVRLDPLRDLKSGNVG